ncbi:MAG TPA: dihydroorotate dehydrogenase, partial [Chroococcales cyanobacterium]
MDVKLGPLRLKNPITLASGTCGYGLEMADFLALEKLGGVFTKGISLAPSPGNPPPRLAETASGLINRIGLQNVGLDLFLSEKLPELVERGVPAIANVAGKTIEEYAMIAERLDAAPGLGGIELNVSCPNVAQGGLAFGTDPATLEKLVSAVRARTGLPLIVKLTPNVTSIGELARAAEAAGADVLSAINTVKALSVQPRLVEGRLVAESLVGGLSGPAIKPIALYCVREIAQNTSLPVIGIGGITCL